MSDTGIALRCANFDGNKDPLSFPADVGRFGEAVLLYDRVVILSHDLRELPGLFHYFGEDAIRTLFEQQVISVHFQQEFPGFMNSASATTIHPGTVVAATPSHPRLDDPMLRDGDDVRHFVRQRLMSYPYLDDYRGVSDATIAAVLARTHLAPPQLAHAIGDGFVEWLRAAAARQALATLIGQRTRRPCLIGHVVDDGGNVRPPSQRRADEQEYVAEHLWNDLLLALDVYYEAALSPLGGDSAVVSDFHFKTVFDVSSDLDDTRFSYAFTGWSPDLLAA